MLDSTGIHLVPSGDGVGPGVAIDLDDLGDADKRLAEVEIVNPHKAPELRAALNKAWLNARKVVAKLVREEGRAKHAVKRRRAEALLKAEGTDTERRAEADLDPAVTAAEDRLTEITAVRVWMEDKATSYKNGYYDVANSAGECSAHLPTPALHGARAETRTEPVVLPGTPPKREQTGTRACREIPLT